MPPLPRFDDFELQLFRLWIDWYSVRGIEVPSGEEPRSVRRLRAVAERASTFGHQNMLLPPAPPDEVGVVSVIGENQGLWKIGYVPDGTDHPDGVVCDYHGGGILASFDSALTRLLYQAAVIDAIFRGPWMSTVGVVQPEDVHALLGPHLVAAELTDGDLFTLPAVWDLGEVLVMGFGDIHLFAGARDLTLISDGPLAQLGRWSAD